MAKFDISYVIKAIDEFSPAAKEIAKSAKEMEKAISKASKDVGMMSKPASKYAKEMTGSYAKIKKAAESSKISLNEYKKAEDRAFKDSDISQAAKAAEEMGKKMDAPVHKTKILGRHLSKVTKKMNESKHSFSEFSDYFATSAYYRLMNVGLPIMGVSIPAIKLLSQIQMSSSALSGMVSNFKELNSQAEELSKSSSFTRADFLVVDQKLAAMGLSGAGIKQSMQGIADYAAATGQSLQQAAQAIGSAATGQKRVGTTDVMALGGTAATRFIRDSIGLSKKFHGIAMAQVATSTQRLAKALDSINESIAQVINASSGPIISLINSVAKVIKMFANWADENKKLAKTIGYVLTAVAAFLAGGVILGSVIGVVSFAVTGLSSVFTALTFVVSASSAVFGSLRAAMVGLDFAMLANPIGIVIAALAALSAAVYEAVKHWDKLKCAIEKVYSLVKDKVSGAFSSLKHQISSLMSPIDAVYGKLKKIENFGGSLFSSPTLPKMNTGQAGGAKHQTSIGQQEKGQASHKVEISVKGTNAEVTAAHVVSDDASMAPILNLGKNYSGGY